MPLTIALMYWITTSGWCLLSALGTRFHWLQALRRLGSRGRDFKPLKSSKFYDWSVLFISCFWSNISASTPENQWSTSSSFIRNSQTTTSESTWAIKHSRRVSLTYCHQCFTVLFFAIYIDYLMELIVYSPPISSQIWPSHVAAKCSQCIVRWYVRNPHHLLLHYMVHFVLCQVV